MRGVACARRGAAALALAGLVAGGAARAAVFVVVDAGDTTDGACTAGSCTLREAMESAVAAPGRDTIRFDPAVFPPGIADPVPIALASAVPALEDPAGTAIDGAGAGVVVVPGGVGAPTEPFAFTSGPGRPLRGVTIASVTVRGFSGTGITICGGALPECDQDVSRVVVENVIASANAAGGMRIVGERVTQVRVAGLVVRANGLLGFELQAETLAGLRIERSGAVANGGRGLRAFASSSATGISVTASFASGNLSTGIDLSGDAALARVRLTNLVARGNGGNGIALIGPGGLSAVRIDRVTAVSSGIRGLLLSGVRASTSLRGIVTIGNGSDGLGVLGGDAPSTGLRITGVQSASNAANGIALLNGVVGARVTDASLVGNAEDGLYLEGGGTVAGNRVSRVHAAGNGANGIQISGSEGSANRIEGCRTSANDGSGIRVDVGTSANLIRGNAALASDADDLFDDNAACANTWQDNVFETSTGTCID